LGIFTKNANLPIMDWRFEPKRMLIRQLLVENLPLSATVGVDWCGQLWD
jgi:hypothetical protein